jgi:membrane-bound metal-dependent hydrolase YbcI (DUF457 family)
VKGISHFSIGVALASCFPQAVAAGAAGHPLYMVLGGLAGLLPDTLDFRIARFLPRPDIHVRPDPLDPNPGRIADAVALAVNRAHAEQKSVSLFLETVRLSADVWQSYEVSFDSAARQVVAKYGPVIETSGAALCAPSHSKPAGSAVACGLKIDYLAATQLGAFDGSLFVMEPLPDGRVSPRFIPWHRKWSHSLLVALAAGLTAWAGLDWTAAGIVASAWAAHGLADQLGFMGSNLLFPLCRTRSEGLKIAHSMDALPNLSAVWISCAVIYWNLQRASEIPVRTMNPIAYGLYVIGLPLALAFAARKWLSRERKRRSGSA